MDDLFQIADWQKVSDLGSGAFGVVSLWKNFVTNDYIGKIYFYLEWVILTRNNSIFYFRVIFLVRII